MPTLAGAVLLIDPTMLRIVLEERVVVVVVEGVEGVEVDTTGRGEEGEEERDMERDIWEVRRVFIWIVV